MAGGQDPDAGDGREPVGDLVGRLVEDGRTALNAEIGVIRAIAAWRVSGLKLGVPLLLGALFLMQAVVTASLVGLVLVLTPRIGAGWATLAVMLVGILLAGLLGWAGATRCRTLFAPLPEEKR